MTCDLNTFRSAIGQFNPNKKWERSCSKNTKCKYPPKANLPIHIILWWLSLNTNCLLQPNPVQPMLDINKLSRTNTLWLVLTIFTNTLLLSGDVHPNPGPISNNKLSVFFLNAQSLKATSKKESKITQFRHMISILQPDIIALNETWLIERIPNSEFADLDDYVVYRKDRQEDIQGGGVLIMVKKSIWSKEHPEWESKDTHNNEITAAEVRPNKTRKIGIITAYRPQTNPCPNFLQNLDITLTNYIQNNVTEFIIIGDFNYSTISWNPLLDTHLPKHSRELVQYLQDHDLKQLNRHSSRKTENNILDLFITNIPDTNSGITCGRYKFKSDHYLLDCEFTMDVTRRGTIPRTVYNYKRANFTSIKEDLQNSKGYPNVTDDVETSWSKIKNTISTTTNKFIPKLKIKNKLNPAWIDDEVIHSSHQKKRALNKYKRTNKPEDHNKFKRLRNNLKNLVTRKYKEYINSITDTLGQNPKRFWTLLKDRSKSKSSPDIITHEGQDITEPNAKSTIFNTYFQSVFSTHHTTEYPKIHKHQDPNLENVILTESEILKELKNINPTKAPGPDGLSSRVLKEAAAEIAKPITTIYNKTIQEGIIPKEWKRANVVPIYKKGKKTEPSNYRPISLLPIISKILERCIFNKIIKHISPKISLLQHGFMKGRSTVTQLMTVLTNISNILDKKTQTDVIYFDLSKAFDSVPHNLLIHKLEQFGIHGRLCNWITNYLTDRYQRVTCEGGNSEWLPVTSGVPQGSILGPLLFLLYINDLPEVLSDETKCAIFADDTKIYRQIRTPADTIALQEDINQLAIWGDKWKLKFNATKCVCLTIHNSVQPTIEMYTMKGAPLIRQKDMNDLGLIVAEDLKWKLHINKIISKANQRLWLIIRTLGFDAPMKAKKTAYVSMVRSILEYGSVIWNPTNKEAMEDLERVQRTATNYITNNPHRTQPGYISYEERLDICKLMPLSYRRELADIIFFCRSYNDDLAFDIKDYIKLVEPGQGRTTRRQAQALTLPIPKTKTTTSAHFYPTRIARIWNAIPLVLRRSIRPLKSSLVIKQHLIPLFKNELTYRFDSYNTCTWIHYCNCNHCKIV